MKSTVGETLRKCRIAAGKSVREMSELLGDFFNEEHCR